MPDLTLPEAAAILGLTRHTVWALATSGALTAHRRRVVGHARPLWFVTRSDVDAYKDRRGDQLGKPGRTRRRQEGSDATV
jgi:predicted DNA-binding transcriptional regulator AlpA